MKKLLVTLLLRNKKEKEKKYKLEHLTNQRVCETILETRFKVKNDFMLFQKHKQKKSKMACKYIFTIILTPTPPPPQKKYKKKKKTKIMWLVNDIYYDTDG